MYANLTNPITQVFVIVTLEIALYVMIVIFTVARTKKPPLIAKIDNPLLTDPQANVSAMFERIQQLDSNKEVFKQRLWEHQSNHSMTVAYALLLLGGIALITSIVYSSSTLAFIGLGLTFWGALLLFVRTTRYVKASLLDSTISSLAIIDQIITNLNYEGKAIYLPPIYCKKPKEGTMFIPFRKELVIPTVKKVAEGKIFLENPQGLCLTPPGLGLANLYEDKLRKDFAKVDLNYLQTNLPPLLIEDLEIAENLEISIENNIVQMRITGSIFQKLSTICNPMVCPLCSSIAIALSRATGKPVIIEKTEVSEEKAITEAYYRIIEE